MHLNLQRIALFIFGVLFTFGLTYNILQSGERNFKQSCLQAETNLQDFQKDFDAFCQDQSLLDKILEDKLSASETRSLYTKNNLFYVYKDGELIFWNKNTSLPEVNLQEIQNTGSLLVQKNGYYVGLKHESQRLTIIGLQLIKHNYPIVNRYLHNDFESPYSFDPSTVIELPSAALGQEIKNNQERPIYKAVYNNYNSSQTSFDGVLVSYITIFSFWFLVFFILKSIKRNFSLTYSYLFLIFSCLIFVELVHLFDFEFKKTILFSPELYASQYFGKSLGNLFVNTFILFLTGGYAAYHYYFKKWQFSKIGFYAYSVFILFVILLYHFVIRSLILDSVISFEINNFTLISAYTFVGLMIIGLLTFTLAIYLYIWLYYCYHKIKDYAYSFVLGLFALCASILFLLGFKLIALLIPLYLLIFAFAYLFLLFNRTYFSRLNYTLLSLFVGTLMISTLLSYYNRINEDNRQETVANQVSENRDLITEYRFEQIQQEIKLDPFFKKFFVSPFVSQKELQQRLNYLYFGGYMSKYNINSIAFNLDGKPIKNNAKIELSYYYDLINKSSEDTFSEWLFLMPNEDGTNNYLSILPIENDGNVNGTLVLELSPKTYHKENLYPELLIEQKINPIAKYRNTKEYEYAIYKNNYLISQAGEYPFPYSFKVFNTVKEYPFALNTEKFRLNFFELDKETKVIVSGPKSSFLVSISIFSYIFCFMGILSFVLYAYLQILNIPSGPFKAISFTFKNKINIAIISITVASFIVVGMVTIGYFRELYKVDNTDKLIKKQKSVLSTLEYLMEKQLDSEQELPSTLNTEITSLAEIQGIDINLFNTDGNLILSSQPGIFANGLVSKKINPLALFQLEKQKSERYIQDESIGNLQYQSVYVPLRRSTGETVAILNLPYFAQEETLRAELSNLMVAIVNVYVLLLLISIIIAFIISSSITRPLANISIKLSQVNLGSKNEGIEWNSDDEIGSLVKEYNKMIAQIEQSASVMAQSERESAWREMARQIAHEIKNPLTPMKLGIQHLQRALVEKPEEANELAKKVSKTMIEQIENLAEIATAFSSFAKMPTANKEKVNLIEILYNVTHLFNQNNACKIHFNPTIQDAIVFADKNQLLSVFNNLVKNAQQATEEKENAKVELFVFIENKEIKIEVKDNGTGISEDKKHKVFVPNFTTKSSGTGLGLAISKQIIENSLGTIWFESIQNTGTSFFVTLPEYKL